MVFYPHKAPNTQLGKNTDKPAKCRHISQKSYFLNPHFLILYQISLIGWKSTVKYAINFTTAPEHMQTPIAERLPETVIVSMKMIYCAKMLKAKLHKK
jgi:hypothetical protein